MKPIQFNNRRNQMQSSGIATCRNAIARIVVVTSLLVISVLASLPEVSRAQTPECPTSLLPPGCSWGNSNGSVNVTIPGTTCTVQVQYCYVCCNGQNYFYMYNMFPQSSDCDAVDPQLYENAAAAMIMTLIGEGGCNPCPNGSTLTTVAFPTCWVKGGISGAYTFSGCGTTTCYCSLSATVTCINGVAHLSGCTETTVGTCSTCTTDPGASNLWVTGTCYSLSCPPLPC